MLVKFSLISLSFYLRLQFIVTYRALVLLLNVSNVSGTKAVLAPVYLLLGDPAETDYTAVGCAVTTISSNLTEMSKGVKLLAALMEDEGGNGQQLLGAAKNLACAVSDMLKTAQPANTEVHSQTTPQRSTHRRRRRRCVFTLSLCCTCSLVRICCRLQETWAKPVESCCPTSERLTLTHSSRWVHYTVCWYFMLLCRVSDITQPHSPMTSVNLCRSLS